MKNTLRFFVEPEALRTDEVWLVDQGLTHQLSRVLRLGPGDRILLLDGLGAACEVELVALGRHEVHGRVVARGAATGEPPVAVTVYLPLIRPERFEWALQKCVELGACRLVPVTLARSLNADRADDRKLDRWRRIAREAAEQSCRALVPPVDAPMAFAPACDQAACAQLALLLCEREAPPLREVLRAGARSRRLQPAAPTLALLSGPEGGIADEELTAARARGIIPVSLGPRILRAETASVAALAALMYELE